MSVGAGFHPTVLSPEYVLGMVLDEANHIANEIESKASQT